jgi:hypothetical protein
MIEKDSTDIPDEVRPMLEGYSRMIDSAIALFQNDAVWENVETANTAFYLDGLVPVLRSQGHTKEITDLFKEFIERDFAEPKVLTRDGVEIRKYAIPNNDLPFELAVYYLLGNDFSVLAAFPVEFEDYYLQRNFIESEKDSVWDSGELVSIRDQYDFNGLTEGYINLQRIVDTILRKKYDNIEDPILNMLTLMAPSIEQVAPPGCAPLIETAIDSIPRMVWGYEQSTEDTDVISMTLEFSPELATNIESISEDIPATIGIEDSIAEFGLGVNLLSLRDNINAIAGFLQQEGGDCVLIDQEAIQEGLMGFNFAMNPMLTQFTGFNVALSAFEMQEGTDQPDLKSLEGVAVFNLEDSNTLMQFAPMLGITVDIPEDGKPVELPEGILPVELHDNVLVARTKTQIALAAGDKAVELIEAAFADVQEDKDMLVRYEISMSEIMNMLSDEMISEVIGETDDANKEYFKEIKELYSIIEKIATGIGLSEKGLKITAEQAFNL